MKIILEAEPKEIAALVLEIQKQLWEIKSTVSYEEIKNKLDEYFKKPTLL